MGTAIIYNDIDDDDEKEEEKRLSVRGNIGGMEQTTGRPPCFALNSSEADADDDDDDDDDTCR